MTSSSRDARLMWLVRGGLLAFTVAAVGHTLGLWTLTHWVMGLPTICPVRLLSGHDCPGCGMGRSLALLADGQIQASLHQHPFGLPVLVWMASWALVPARGLAVIGRSWPVRSSALGAAAVGLLLLWWLVARVA